MAEDEGGGGEEEVYARNSIMNKGSGDLRQSRCVLGGEACGPCVSALWSNV